MSSTSRTQAAIMVRTVAAAASTNVPPGVSRNCREEQAHRNICALLLSDLLGQCTAAAEPAAVIAATKPNFGCHNELMKKGRKKQDMHANQ